jgi:hypothetical protein
MHVIVGTSRAYHSGLNGRYNAHITAEAKGSGWVSTASLQCLGGCEGLDGSMALIHRR